MKRSTSIAALVICVSALIVAYQFYQWRADRRLARDMAYACADNSDYLIDPLDMSLSDAQITPVLVSATGKPLLYKGQPVKNLAVPSLTTQASRYKCTMYKDAENGRWTVIPRRIIRDMESDGTDPQKANPFSK